MGQEEALLSATVAFSWEHEQGVLTPVLAPAMGAPDMSDSPTKPPAPATVVLPREHEPGATKPYSTPAVKPRGVPESARNAQAPTRRLSVPPPPGRPSPRGHWRAVRPEDDPFLAAYLACTRSSNGSGEAGNNRTTGAPEPKGRHQRRLGWGRLSCKTGDGAVVQSMVRMSKLPELHPRDA
jgi:hypothetical protein